ncbi:MAG: hypothetical protein CM1200mP29_11720 [Verrucomicrobiota bacterium]|nr:MAG: hypothetical protein CM1200mP29_11720 [Verrucomicrobiota bacterium]
MIYFSDPRYVGDEKEEQDQMAVYRYNPTDGSVKLAIGADQVEKPNGIALSPDGGTLYVAENNNTPNGRMTLNAFTIHGDGSLGPKKVIVDFGAEAGIDGMTIDVQGNIYAAVRSTNRFGIVVYTSSGFGNLGPYPDRDTANQLLFWHRRGSQRAVRHGRRWLVPHHDERRRIPPLHRSLGQGRLGRTVRR